MSIKSVHARQIFDSRGNPTVEVDLIDEKGTLHRAAVPSGASTGVHEALELRDKEKIYGGKGVLKAVKNVNEIIAPELVKSGLSLTDQKGIDDFLLKLDGTENKAKLGANAILGVSMAVARAGAATKGLPLYSYLSQMAGAKTDSVLPVPFMNVINGGSHAGNGLAFQEFMLAPTGAKTFTEAMQIGTEIYHVLQKVLIKRFGSTGGIGDEGGFAPAVKGAQDSLEVLVEAISTAGYEGKVSIAMDVASSEFFKDGKYDLNFKDEKNPQLVSGQELAAMYMSFIEKFPIVSIEDPFAEDDWESWTHFLGKVKGKIQVVGDDLTVTNPVRIKKAIDTKACNALLLKINQIGTITESMQACKDSLNAGWGVMVSHRSGETGDTFIADLSVALGGGQLKTGAPARSERVEKYNQLLRIEEQLGSKASYAGLNAIPGLSK